LQYDLYLGVTTQPPLALFTNDLTNIREITGLNYATTYYWKVVARDNHYAYTSGPLYSFITRDSPWFFKKEMPSPRYGFGTAVVNNKIYVIGGTDGWNYLSEVLEYDPAVDAWTRKADMPTPRSSLGVAVWNGKIYAVGGRSSVAVFKNNEVYDPLSNIWSSLAPMPIPDDNITSAHAINGKIYTIGPVLEYDIAADDWWDSMTIIADTVAPDTILFDTVYNYVKSHLPNFQRCHCSTVYNNLIYVMGGANFSGLLSTVDVYHPETNTWSAASDMIGPANFPAAVTANGFIYVLGGYSSGYLRRVRKYDPLTDAWFVRGDMQGYRSSFGAAFINNHIYAFGGVALFPLSTMEEYRIELDPKR